MKESNQRDERISNRMVSSSKSINTVMQYASSLSFSSEIQAELAFSLELVSGKSSWICFPRIESRRALESIDDSRREIRGVHLCEDWLSSSSSSSSIYSYVGRWYWNQLFEQRRYTSREKTRFNDDKSSSRTHQSCDPWIARWYQREYYSNQWSL